MANLVSNKKAYLNYEIGDKLTAGIELFGHEVKSLRKGQGSLEGSYIIVRGGEAFLIGAYIPPFQASNTPASYNERRNRTLLLNKKEIAELAHIEHSKTSSIIPLSIFTAGPKIKIEIAYARGKKKGDKRQAIKKRDTERDLKRKL
ncbi:MAG: SsrA-binding protein SmpB [Candidatus Paceibacterota bacterium]|jgi:SsrA-binding protein